MLRESCKKNLSMDPSRYRRLCGMQRARRALRRENPDIASVSAVAVEVTVTGNENFVAKLTKIDLHRLRMQRFSENLARIYHVDGWGGRGIILFRTQTGPSLLHNGLELQPNNVVRFSEGQSYYQRSSGSAYFGGMSLSMEDMASVGATMAGRDLTPPRVH
jgi:hypothetical protein